MSGVTPTHRAALGLLGVAVVGLIFWFEGGHDLRAWAPNVTVGAVSIAATITIIDKALQREAHNHLGPRIESVIDELAPSFKWLMVAIASDYHDTRQAESTTPSFDSLSLAQAWLDDGGEERVRARKLPDPGYLPTPAVEALKFADRLERTRSRDRELLQPTAVRAVDDFTKWVREAAALYEIVDPENRAEARSSLEILIRTIVWSTKDFIEVFGSHFPDVVEFEYRPDRGPKYPAT